MPKRLTASEVSLLALDTAHTPSHVGTVHIFDPGSESFDYERLIGLIRDRIAYVPRYRQPCGCEVRFADHQLHQACGEFAALMARLPAEEGLPEWLREAFDRHFEPYRAAVLKRGRGRWAA